MQLRLRQFGRGADCRADQAFSRAALSVFPGEGKFDAEDYAGGDEGSGSRTDREDPYGGLRR